MTATIPDVPLHTWAGANTTLRQELERQPWLTERERIEAAVEAAVAASREDDIAEAALEKAFEDGKEEGDGKRQPQIDDMRDLLDDAGILFNELRELASEDQQAEIDELRERIRVEVRS